jgi:hypothetical protein
MVVILHTCDKYQFCWNGFIRHFIKHWDYRCFKYFCNEDIEVDYDYFIQRKTGKGEWSDRLISILKRTSDDYVFYIQEDYWLKEYISSILIDHLLQLMKVESIDCIHMSPDSKYYTLTPYSGNLKAFDSRSAYLMNHQPGIWRKDFLLECLESNETPWVNEIEGTKRLWKKNLIGKVMNYDLNWFDHVVRKGKFTERGVELNSQL